MKWWLVYTIGTVNNVSWILGKLSRDFTPAVNNLHQGLILGNNAQGPKDQLERPCSNLPWDLSLKVF